MSDAKTEAEAFLAMQRSVEGISDPTWLRVAKDKFCQFAEHTALPRLTLELVAENEKLREAVKPVLFRLWKLLQDGHTKSCTLRSACDCGYDRFYREVMNLEAALQEPTR